MANQHLTIMCGIPGSGKSTWVKDHKKPEEIVICLDDIRKEIFGHQYHAPAEQFVIAIGEAMVRLLLRQGCSIILDSTAPTWGIRKKWIDMAQSYGCRSKIVYIETDFDECIDRNKRREDDKVVPDEAMDKFMDIFQEPTANEVVSDSDFIVVDHE